MRGNVLDLAVGFIMGGAFGTIVKSLVDDVIMPPIGLALGNVDFSNLFVVLKQGTKAAPPYSTIAEAHAALGHTSEAAAWNNRINTNYAIALGDFTNVNSRRRARPRR